MIFFRLLFLVFLFLKPFYASCFDWLAFGDLRGHLDSCGCDPQTDLGGIDRLGSLIDRERSLHKNLIIFSLGNLTSDHEQLTTEDLFILKAVHILKPDVSLVNIIEIKHSIKLEYQILSNGEGYKPFWSNNEMMVWGYTEHSELKTYSLDLQKIWESQWRDKKLKKILLYSGSDDILKRIQTYGFFDLIISSNTHPLTAMVDQSERQNQKKIERFSGIFMTPLGGNGVLRGGALQKSIAKSLFIEPQSQDLNAFSKKTDDHPQFILSEEYHPVSWLDRSYEGSGPLSQLFLDYQKASQDSFDKLIKERLPNLQSSPYAGAQSCQGCHSQAYEVWSKSLHSHALNTLEKVHQDQNPACINCHVVGFDQKGGFVSQQHSPHLAHVQCETCHGPRKDHIQNPKLPLKKKSAMDICRDCHHPPHSGNFHEKEYWNKIRHGK